MKIIIILSLKFKSKENYFTYPTQSSNLGNSEVQIIGKLHFLEDIENIILKLVLLPFENAFVAQPMIIVKSWTVKIKQFLKRLFYQDSIEVRNLRISYMNKCTDTKREYTHDLKFPKPKAMIK